MQLGVALVDPSSLSKATFAAPRGGAAGSLTLPAADLGLGAASAELSFTTLQVDTHSATANLSARAATEHFDVSFSDHATLAPRRVHSAPAPLVLLIPVDPTRCKVW